MGYLLSTNSELSSLKDFTPLYSNIFEVEITSVNDEKIYEYGKFHITGFSINGAERLSLSRHPVTKKFYLDSSTPYTWLDGVSLTWRENSSLSVRKFHEDWLNMFYSRKHDHYISAEEGDAIKRYKNFLIKFPSSSPTKEGPQLKLKNVLPLSIPTLAQFSWSTQASNVTYSLEYRVEDWEWIDEKETSSEIHQKQLAAAKGIFIQ